MIKLLSVCWLLIGVVFGINVVNDNCGNENVDKMGMRTTNIPGAQSNGKFLANVYSKGRWQRLWRKIDNAKCDDFKRGEADFFDDFNHVKGRWDAVALYACTNDGVVIESFFYWDGTKQAATIVWDPSVYGPGRVHCLRNDHVSATVTKGKRAWYSDILVDGDTPRCNYVVFKTGREGQRFTRMPARPYCQFGEVGDTVPAHPDDTVYVPDEEVFIDIKPEEPLLPDTNTYSLFEQQLLNYLMGVIGIALLLFISNSCLMAYAIKNKNRGGSKGYYGKVVDTDIE